MSAPHPLITLDARLVGIAAGIAQYTLHLARALAELEGPERYYLLLGRRSTEVDLPRHVSRSRALTPAHHRLERLALPLDVLTRAPGTRLLHSVDHVAPLWGPWRRVVTVHDLAFLRLPETHTAASRAYYARARDSALRADHVIAVSESTRRDVLERFGVPAERVTTVHEAAAPVYVPRPREALLQVAARHGLDPTRPYVLAVGTLEPRKNYVLLLEAFARLPQTLDAQLVVVGARGWLEAPIFEARDRLGLGERVCFPGLLPPEELAVLYSHASVFAFPSLYEGFGLPLLEAMACGAPVVSSNAGPMPEVVADAALLLAPEDPGVWSATLERVIADPTLAADLKRRGFARAAQFSWRRAAEETRAVYRQVLAS